jgi:TPR repeat protein
MVRKIVFVWFFCVFCLATTELRAEDFKVSPLPLAENARIKPDRTVFDMLDARHRKDRTRYSVLIGMHDWAALEKEYLALEGAYRAKSIDSDEYVRTLKWFAPDNGKIQLADLEQWVEERPKSYIAWFTLGLQYQNAAWDERGQRYASQTSREQFAAMEKFGTQAHAALRKSITLAPRPVASYAEMVGAAMLVARPRISATRWASEFMRARNNPHCASDAPPAGDFATSYDEQLNYVCLAYAADPEMSAALARFLYFQAPRWGGSFEDSERLLSEFEAGRKMPARTVNVAKAKLLSERGTELVERNPKAAVQYLLNAFDLDPRLRNVGWLEQAAHAAHWGAKDMAMAVACADKLIAMVPDDPEALANRGWAYEALSDHRHYMENMIAAAMLGKMEAQNNLGYYYMVGQRGLPKDLQQARAWLTLAANQGFQHSRDKLQIVEEMIRKEARK